MSSLLSSSFEDSSPISSYSNNLKKVIKKKKSNLSKLKENEQHYQTNSDSGTESSSTNNNLIKRYKKPSFKLKTLVLDLDETLIHSTSRMASRKHDHMVEVLIDKHICMYYVYKRPHVDYFLQKVSEWYKVVIFTASMAEYADPVIDWLDKSKTLISSRYFRQSCTLMRGVFLKDLTVIDQDLSNVCLIDNSSASFSLQMDNAIPIESWLSDKNDVALLDLLPFLEALRFCHDVRSILSLRV
ncbi:Nuclear envelope morphology protein 1 [Clydaea vesicula]|uniref:Nuclear envelope morphology protein 1 n=1 Tax=Clydaea vesicula TaxID=447962 RepID=A0AAD5U3W2_9FUNG|nr:Nuclear envelope morphology protein 1 [Clydaea vesicula]KAJ3391330.1 Nuclear envelope morphology protein 1 [Lobulomyces angularis]